jgi:dephospho-CoA kinase
MSTRARQRFRVGLTGGIASGKSFVADLFAEQGVPVIDTDLLARDVVAPGEPALAEIEAEFGGQILTAEGHLDRRALRDLVFADANHRRRLEAIVHPRIRRETEAAADRADGPYQLLVVPLLVETGFADLTDRVLVVDCPETLQRKRLMARDNEDPLQVERILGAQAPRQVRLDAADDIIDNGGSAAATRRQVENLHQQYLALAESA